MRITARTGPIAAELLAVALLAAACGGGDGASVFISFNAPPAAVSQPGIVLSGGASLPAGSERLTGSVFYPYPSCQLGANTITWSNATNGSSGTAIGLWDCPTNVFHWTSTTIPLATGPNAITVRMTDGAGTTEASTTIERN